MPETRIFMERLFDLAGDFVKANNGTWNHTDWEKCLVEALKAGAPDTDATRLHLGNLLEAGKHFFHVTPPPPPVRRTPVAAPTAVKAKSTSKVKSKAKAKPKAKAKAKAKAKS